VVVLGASSAAGATQSPIVLRVGATGQYPSLAVGTDIACLTPAGRLMVRVPPRGENQAQLRTNARMRTKAGVVFNLEVIYGSSETAVRCTTQGLPIYTATATAACLKGRYGVATRSDTGAIPMRAEAGAFRAIIQGNTVQVSFGTNDAVAELALKTLGRGSRNVLPGLPERLRIYDNVLTLWRATPTDAELGRIVSCLR
jgi:hypothetical protein